VFLHKSGYLGGSKHNNHLNLTGPPVTPLAGQAARPTGFAGAYLQVKYNVGQTIKGQEISGITQLED
jgi:hypothetical protein